jgi:acyl-coenzyme A synthetase/AMP-(fatty) acid ligase
LTKPRAYLVLREGFQQSAALIEELRQNVRAIGSYKIPASFVFIDELPRTTLSKIDRRALRAAAPRPGRADGRAGNQGSANTST